MKNIKVFLPENFQILGVKFSIYLNRRDFVKESEKGLPLGIKKAQNHENRRLGLIESLHMQHGSLRSCRRPIAPAKAVFDFKIARIGSMIQKEIKYNLHYIMMYEMSRNVGKSTSHSRSMIRIFTRRILNSQ